MISIWAAVLSGIFALLGIIVGGIFQFYLANLANKRARDERMHDAKSEDQKTSRKLQMERGIPALKVARHLEHYAHLCANTVATNSTASGYEPYASFPNWTPWPEGVTWELLGATTSARAQDFETRVSLHESRLSGDIEFGASDATDVAQYAGQTSARAGFEAWHIARSIRAEADLPAFTFVEHVWDYPETLREAVEEEQQKERESAARRALRDDGL